MKCRRKHFSLCSNSIDMNKDNRQIRIFISSTFRDMNAERDYLITKVFPRLKAEAAKRDVTIIPLDLRWGVTEEESKTGKVIEICLDEIRNSRPFFIGLVGNRYGWCPDESELKKNKRLAERYGWLLGDLQQGLSVTEIEMQYGVLRTKEKINAHFFLKDGGKDDEPEKLSRLRESILNNKRYPVYHYTKVDQLGEQVEQAFLKLLDELYPLEALSQLEKDRQAQRSFVMSRTEVYIPNKQHYAKLDKWLNGTEQELVVTGESGMGKSALIANWLMTHIDDQDRNFIFHFIGNGGEDGNKDAILARLTREVRAQYNLPTPEKETGDAKTICDQALAQINGQKPLVIVLDAVNQLQEANNQKELTWLPTLPPNVRVLYSTLSEDPTMKVFKRLKYPMFVLEPLDKKARKQLATDYLAYYSKHLTDEQIDRIITAPVVENTLVLRTLLDELIGFGSHEELDNRIGMYLAAKDTEDFFRIVLERYETDFDKELIAQILALIGFSRRGMAEDELKTITKANTLQFSQFYCAIRQNLMVRNGLLCFSHAHITNAVRARYKERELSARKAICALLCNEDNNRAYDEVAWQYFQRGEWPRLHNWLVNVQAAFAYHYEEAIYDLALYWRTMIAADPEKYSFAACMEMVDEDKRNDAIYALGYYCQFADQYLNDFQLALRFAERGLEINLKLYGEESLDTARAYDILGTEHAHLAHQEETYEYMEKALKIRSKLLPADDPTLAISYDNLGAIADTMGRQKEALEWFEKAEAIKVAKYGEGSVEVAFQRARRCNALIAMKRVQEGFDLGKAALEVILKNAGESNPDVADLYLQLGTAQMMLTRDSSKCLPYFEKALEIDRRLFGDRHSRVAADYSHVGGAYLLKKDQKKAIECFTQLLEIRVAIYGERHPQVGYAYLQLGSAYGIFHKWEPAMENYAHALELFEEAYGEEYRGCVSAHIGMAKCCANTKRRDEAAEHQKKAYEIQRALVGEDDPNTQKMYKEWQSYENMRVSLWKKWGWKVILVIPILPIVIVWVLVEGIIKLIKQRTK